MYVPTSFGSPVKVIYGAVLGAAPWRARCGAGACGLAGRGRNCLSVPRWVLGLFMAVVVDLDLREVWGPRE